MSNTIALHFDYHVELHNLKHTLEVDKYVEIVINWVKHNVDDMWKLGPLPHSLFQSSYLIGQLEKFCDLYFPCDEHGRITTMDFDEFIDYDDKEQTDLMVCSSWLDNGDLRRIQFTCSASFESQVSPSTSIADITL